MAPGKPIVIITWVGQKPELSSILLTSHMDVVPVYSVSNIFFFFYRAGMANLLVPMSQIKMLIVLFFSDFSCVLSYLMTLFLT